MLYSVHTVYILLDLTFQSVSSNVQCKFLLILISSDEHDLSYQHHFESKLFIFQYSKTNKTNETKRGKGSWHGGIENPRWPPALIIIVLHEYFVFGADWKSKIPTIGISLRWKNFFPKTL